MKFYLLLLKFTLFSLLANAQFSVRGSIRDEDTNELLIGATITFSTGEKAILSNEKGEFSTQLKTSKTTITIKYIGYKAYTAKLNLNEQTQPLVFLLKKNENELAEVVVKNDASLQETERPLLGVNTLNIKTINKLPTPLGETDILKGLQMLPGVNSVGEASNGLNVRGGTTDQNLILLDNAPIFNPTHMFGLFSAFPSDAISGLQLFKGNIPAKYGGRTASVLDISLSNPSLTKFSLNGGISMVSEKLRLDIPVIKDKVGLLIAGRGSFNDFILPIVSPKFKEMKSNFGDIAAKLFFKLGSKNTISLSNYLSYDFFQTELLGTINSVNATSTQFRYKTNNISGKWIYAINSKNLIETIVVNSVYQPDILLPELNSANKVKVSQQISYQQLKSNYRHTSNNNAIEIGFDVLKYGINPGELIPNKSESVAAKTTDKEFGLESGIYISDEIKVNEKLDISAGLRYSNFMNLGPATVRLYAENEPKRDNTVVSTQDYTQNKVSKSYGGLEPRLGLKYAISQSLNLKFGYNLSRQYLQQISNTTTPLPTSRWKLADFHIKPQVSQLATIGVTKNLSDELYQLGVEVYYRKSQNVIDFKSGADFFLKNFPETELLQGFNKSYGIELMASKEKGMLTGWINYTYARSLNKINEGNLPEQRINNGNFYAANYDRPHTVNASIVIGQGKHHDFSFNFTYSTGRPFTTPQGYVEFNNNLLPYYSDRNNARIPDYHRLDFAWNIYNPKMNPNRRFKGNWAFSVYNLYGRKNPYSVFYRAENRVLNPYKLTIFGSPIPSLAYKFTFE
ncbi:MAG: TonB-dependent receptor [Emticicia sp.]|uniref:TonB-dependent receptor n=1 Tax=Emticicia sp. TaxID=1930953 RepID=UPI003BA5AB40